MVGAPVFVDCWLMRLKCLLIVVLLLLLLLRNGAPDHFDFELNAPPGSGLYLLNPYFRCSLTHHLLVAAVVVVVGDYLPHQYVVVSLV